MGGPRPPSAVGEPWLAEQPTSAPGRLRELRLYAEGPEADPRLTSFEYRLSGGRTDEGDDYAPGAWVADLERITDPRGGESSFTLADDGTGNPIARTDPEGGTATAAYGQGSDPLTDPPGVVVSETDEVGGTTTYLHFHPAGLPEQVVGPKGNDPEAAGALGTLGELFDGLGIAEPLAEITQLATGPDAHTTSYRYDAVGNLIHLTDPRAEITARPPASGEQPDPEAPDPRTLPFTTTLDYDGFDRLVAERIAKRTDPEVEVSDPDERWITRARAYERNGNPTAERDGVGEITRYRHGPTDLPIEIDAPGSGGREVACLGYDPDDLLVAQLAPKAPGSGPGACPIAGLDPRVPHGAELARDALGQPLAELAHDPASELPGQRQLISSYAYDRRGNQVGVVDPNRNPGGGPVDGAIATAIANARTPAQRRISRRFNAADELIAERERPASDDGPLGVRRTEHDYDPAGNPIRTTHPRSFRDRPSGHSGPVATERLYDDANRLVAEVDPLGRATRIVRRPNGQPASITSPRGMEGKEPFEAPPDEFTTELEYDPDGDLISRSVPYAPDQYHRDEAEFAGDEQSRGWKVSYERDPVGDPVEITDARGNAFTNAFYDTGELQATTRPSWWGLDWGPGQDNPRAGERFAGGAADTDVLVPPADPRSPSAREPRRTPRREASFRSCRRPGSRATSPRSPARPSPTSCLPPG